MNKKTLTITIIILTVILVAGIVLCIGMSAALKDPGQNDTDVSSPVQTQPATDAPEQDTQADTKETVSDAEQTVADDTNKEEPVQPTEEATEEATQAPTQAPEMPTETEEAEEPYEFPPLKENELPWD